MRTENYATGLSDKKLTVYGNEEVESRFCQAARIDGSVSKFVRFQRLEPFDCVNTEDGYEITAVLADHNQPEKSLLYLIKRVVSSCFMHMIREFSQRLPGSFWKENVLIS